MSHEELASALEVVNRELGDIEHLDADQLAQLRSTVNEIQQALDAKQIEPSLTDQLRDSAQSFEHSHPKLTETLSNLVDILQRMGI